MQIFNVVFVRPTIVWIFRRLGFQTLRVRFLAWLTLFPVTVPLPHMSHLRAIKCLPSISELLWRQQHTENACECKEGAASIAEGNTLAHTLT